MATAPTHGIVAAGDAATAEAAITVLEAGGNAFDAVLAAGFAAAVCEPCFTSLAGGGFLLAHTSAGDDILFDFFVDTPGLGLATAAEPVFEQVAVAFAAATQAFHCGPGSVAVPGTLAGYLHVHGRLGRLPLDEVVEPAARLALDGTAVSPTQAHVFGLLAPILTRTEASRAIFAPEGALLAAGATLRNPELGTYLRALGDDPNRSFHAGDAAQRLADQIQAGGGLLTVEDLTGYQVIEREPLRTTYRGRRILTNPPPTFGGALLALALARLEAATPRGLPRGAERATRLVEVMAGVDADRAAAHPDVVAALAGAGDAPLVSRGTTHITVADDEGNVAAMTTSNGECSGDIIEGLGVATNNMLGEDDLHPDGFHAAPPGTRVASMMAPTFVLDSAGDVALALGSGGSKRIRSALLQVLTAVVDDGADLTTAVSAARVHWDEDHVEAEPGLGPLALDALSGRWPVNRWPEPNLYFGGVHAVQPGRAGAGDARRGGVVRRT